MPMQDEWALDSCALSNLKQARGSLDCGIFVYLFMDLDSLNFPLKIKCSHCVYFQMSDMVGSDPATIVVSIERENEFKQQARTSQAGTRERT